MNTILQLTKPEARVVGLHDGSAGEELQKFHGKNMLCWRRYVEVEIGRDTKMCQEHR